MTTADVLARPAALLHARSLGRGFLLGFLGTLVVSMVLLAASASAVGVRYAGRIMPGVRVAGVDVGGLAPAAAGARLRAELPPLSGGGVTVLVDGMGAWLSNDELARAYDVEAIIDAALGVARSDDLMSDAIEHLRVLTKTHELPVIVSAVDSDAVDRAVRALVDRFSVTPRSAQIRRKGGEGYVVEPGTEGARLDADELRAALLAALPSTDTEAVEIATEVVEPALTTAAAEEAARQANAMTSSALVLRADDQRFRLRPVQLARQVEFGVVGGVYAATIDEAGLRDLVKPLRGQVAQDPRNAWFARDGGRIVGVIPARDGLKLDVRRSASAIAAALEARVSGGRGPVPLVLAAVTPATPTDDAEAGVPRLELVGSWTTYYEPGENNAWNANIHIPAWDLDGHVVRAGQWFSFWNDIGPVTVERGYGYGGVIIGGRSLPTGALAGGICSTSTTLFNAAMRAGLDIGQRVNHSYYIERYPVGLDATVLKTQRSVTDMTFRNDTANPIVIRSYTGYGWVRFDLWGVPDGRTVSLSAPITSTHVAARETVVVNPDLAPGTAVRVEFPHNGFTAVVTRTVRDGTGNVLHADVWRSFYRVVNGITEVGPSA
jgi:vancomycin resistance protein YoaR